ncbi:GNAT family N-acetyltransferase [Flavobacterium sp. CYK-4]|uniref:GNAT family N-acetyltransferase n=1 Tax=Flavobacterium lotistagni TaxID=2709660 RepID=UPI001407CC66|nr:GNAT family N-acetyltransferase [Flavobacterium lotistagni]NHM05708.1 GNAT family N-acetyltransferase [Flavobacterium lotistagni]
MNPYSFKLYASASELPEPWDQLAATNVFLSSNYFRVLQESAPTNMTCHFIGLFDGEELIGIALSQFLDLNQLESFGERDQCMKTYVRNFVFRNFASHVLFIGNNMLTGQNAFLLLRDCDITQALRTIHKATEALEDLFRSKGKPLHIITYKDFESGEIALFDTPEFKPFYRFSTQPNMTFHMRKDWNSVADYVASLHKKYRDQYKRANKKAQGIQKRPLALEDILSNEQRIYELYFHVAKNAPFNTFFLEKNHFSAFKRLFGNQFLFYGYFLDGKMIGFNTMIKNGNSLDTYFLGYDETLQREKMLYLNMLYDMIAYGIENHYEVIIFSRTALEIKSSVGALPVKTYGLIRHRNGLINRFMSRIFPLMEPEVIWQERSPFQTAHANVAVMPSPDSNENPFVAGFDAKGCNE